MRRFSINTLFVLAGVIAVAALAELSALHFLLPLENRLSDFFVRTHALKLQADRDIVIVDIDEKSLARMADEVGRWQWPRSVHGELVAAIEKQHPRAIIFDLTFTEKDIDRPESDAVFDAAVAATDNTYFPMVRLEANGDHVGVPIGILAPLAGIEPTGEAQQDARLAISLPVVLAEKNWRVGTINFTEDDDGVGRRYDLYIPAYGWRIPSLPARVARDLGYAVPERQEIILGWRGGALSHPHISYSDLYQDAGRKTPLRDPHELENKIVIIGASAAGLHDIRNTPISGRHTAVEIIATAVDNLKNRGYLQAAPAFVAPLLTMVLVVGLLLAFLRLHRHTLALGAGMLAVTAILLFAGYIAVAWQWLVPVLVPLLFAWLFYFSAALAEYLRERRAREQAVQMFNRFLDPRVVEQLVGQGKTVESLSGQTQTLTVLFSDIRNFTTYSEQHTAPEVVAMLNRYFSMQVEVIFRHGGTLDKFIGDAIMAFWGAPTADPAHASNAIAAALEMAERLQEYKRELGEAGAAFDVGIGIHSGPAVVGFIGSERRQDYTAIGDTVNLASRIEGQTKGVARILVSAETKALCEDMFDFIDHGFYKVKGRNQEVHLFEPRGKMT